MTIWRIIAYWLATIFLPQFMVAGFFAFGRWLGLGDLAWSHFLTSAIILIISNVVCIVATWDNGWAKELEAAQGARRAKAEEERQKLREHVNKLLDEADK